mmetsp:Transcript_2668/g.9036  ORF Transcript_2668/g.9036 Transcript_2668/m.9036 type:complete len:267 (+) Transcript_2668:2784-3584(+)
MRAGGGGVHQGRRHQGGGGHVHAAQPVGPGRDPRRAPRDGAADGGRHVQVRQPSAGGGQAAAGHRAVPQGEQAHGGRQAAGADGQGAGLEQGQPPAREEDVRAGRARGGEVPAADAGQRGRGPLHGADGHAAAGGRPGQGRHQDDGRRDARRADDPGRRGLRRGEQAHGQRVARRGGVPLLAPRAPADVRGELRRRHAHRHPPVRVRRRARHGGRLLLPRAGVLLQPLLQPGQQGLHQAGERPRHPGGEARVLRGPRTQHLLQARA